MKDLLQVLRETEILFSDQEVETFTKTRKLILTPEALRHFENHLMRAIAEMHATLPKHLKEMRSEENTEIKVNDKVSK